MFSFTQFIKKGLFPSVRADDDEDVVNPRDAIDESCTEKDPILQKLKEKWDTCQARVHSRKKTEELCSEEAIDFMNALNVCAAPRLIEHLGGPGKVFSGDK